MLIIHGSFVIRNRRVRHVLDYIWDVIFEGEEDKNYEDRILTGGGDCPGLNPAIRGAVMRLLDYGDEVIGFTQGWKGLVEGNTEPLTLERVEGIIDQGELSCDPHGQIPLLRGEKIKWPRYFPT